jgi:AcrR family transcriptional regulator
VIHWIRREAIISTQDVILNAAERIFGEHGFGGASMREIAQVAGVAQALLHYHFRNKEALYQAIFERRATTIRDVRRQRLEALFSDDRVVTIEDVLQVLFMSLEDLLGEPRGNLRYYVQMLAQVTVSPDQRSSRIMREFYDPSAEHFITAFRRVLPDLSQERAVWAYLFAIGARMQAHTPSGRAARLGAASEPSTAYRLLVPFVAAGIRATGALPTPPRQRDEVAAPRPSRRRRTTSPI